MRADGAATVFSTFVIRSVWSLRLRDVRPDAILVRGDDSYVQPIPWPRIDGNHSDRFAGTDQLDFFSLSKE